MSEVMGILAAGARAFIELDSRGLQDENSQQSGQHTTVPRTPSVADNNQTSGNLVQTTAASSSGSQSEAPAAVATPAGQATSQPVQSQPTSAASVPTSSTPDTSLDRSGDTSRTELPMDVDIPSKL